MSHEVRLVCADAFPILDNSATRAPHSLPLLSAGVSVCCVSCTTRELSSPPGSDILADLQSLLQPGQCNMDLVKLTSQSATLVLYLYIAEK